MGSPRVLVSSGGVWKPKIQLLWRIFRTFRKSYFLGGHAATDPSKSGLKSSRSIDFSISGSMIRVFSSNVQIHQNQVQVMCRPVLEHATGPLDIPRPPPKPIRTINSTIEDVPSPTLLSRVLLWFCPLGISTFQIN